MKKISFILVALLFIFVFLPLTDCSAQQNQKKSALEEMVPPTAPPPVPPTPELYEEGENSEEGIEAQNEEARGLIKKQNQGENKGPNEMGLNRRSQVANAVGEMLRVADRNGGIGQQIRVMAQAQNQNQEQVEANLAAVKNRGRLKKFFFGPDYKRLNTVEEKLANHAQKLAELKKLAAQVAGEEDRAALEAQIGVMEQAAVEIQKEASSEKKGFSLFGWLNRMLSK